MGVEKFIDEMDNQATSLWQGHGLDIERLNEQIIDFLSVLEKSVVILEQRGIAFPMEYVEEAMVDLKKGLGDRDDYKVADCLYYQWKEIAIVLKEVLDED